MALSEQVRHREFKAPEQNDLKPVTFTLEGEEFECIAEAPGAVLTDFLADVGSGHVGRSAGSLTAFFLAVLIEDDVDRFVTHIHSKDVVIPIETLGDLVIWLVEEYSGRPTKPPSGSRAGRRTTKGTSTGGSASRAKRPSESFPSDED